jgi:hypothetical protein
MFLSSIEAVSSIEYIGRVDTSIAFEDPEVDLCFSNTFIQEGVDPAPVHLIFLSANLEEPSSCTNVRHFEVDLVETRQKNPTREIVNQTPEKSSTRQEAY